MRPAQRIRSVLSPVETIIRRSPIESVVSNLYWKIDFLLANEHQTVTLNDTTCTFFVETLREFQRISSLSDEDYLIGQLMEDIQPTDVVWDIGANIGTHASYFSTQLDGGSLIAFEPEPSAAGRARQNIDLNADGNQWQVNELALSDTNEQTALNLQQNSIGYGGHQLSADGDLTIQQTRASSLLDKRGYAPPDVIKIDVEGAELNVLRGFGEFLSRVRVIGCEVHPERLPTFGAEPGDITKLLAEAGFEVSHLGDRKDEHHIRAVSTDLV